MPSFSFSIRAVQLDLARQMETIPFIKGFLDFIADNGYNTVVFYLEGRIRTPSFPDPSPKESYSEAEMSEVIRYARSRGIEPIPAVSVLGHAELFLRHSRLAGLSETRPPFAGRFGPGLSHVFCPSQTATYEFLGAYLTEVHRLFDSRYFHVGCDEAWDMACCDLCKARLRNGESQADLFAKHLSAIHQLVTGQLGARMIIWDDMFEYYLEALLLVPRDILLACWQYQDNVETVRAHFANRRAFDALSHYDRLGFDYLICPSDYTLCNTESFTAYAAAHRPLGGLLTTWEKAESFLLQDMPLIAFVGRFWEEGALQSTGPLLRTVAEELFGVSDESFFRAVEAWCRSGFYLERRTALDDFLTRRENHSTHPRRSVCEVLLALLSEYRGKVTEAGRLILEEMLLSLRSEQAAFQLDDLLPQLLELGAGAACRKERLEELCRTVQAIGVERLKLWEKIRPGIDPRPLESLYETYLTNLREVPALAEQHGVLKVHFLLPDQYSSQTVRISIRYAGDSDDTQVATGVFKELRDFDCFYSKRFLIAKDRVPLRLKIESWGYGGQGFTFFELKNNTGQFVPASVEAISGVGEDLRNLLVPDWKWAFVGERDTMKAYLDETVATAVHAFEITLEKVVEERSVDQLKTIEHHTPELMNAAMTDPISADPQVCVTARRFL